MKLVACKLFGPMASEVQMLTAAADRCYIVQVVQGIISQYVVGEGGVEGCCVGRWFTNATAAGR